MSEEVKVKPLPTGVPWEVGQVREVPFRLSTADVIVDCLVADTRQVYGRTEWQITPVSGRGSAWVSEKGPMAGGIKRQSRHEKED